jgi:quercetin dioxygenase-like cupin family protein
MRLDCIVFRVIIVSVLGPNTAAASLLAKIFEMFALNASDQLEEICMSETNNAHAIAIEAASAPPPTKPSNYPEPFFSRMAGREKPPLGDLFGLKNFGVNLTKLAPGGESALMHRHSKRDEFIFFLEGEPTLVTNLLRFAIFL